MRIHVDPTGLSGLLAYLRQQKDCICSATDDGDVEVTIIGSYADGGAAELERRLAAWRAGATKPSVTELGRVRTALRARALSPLRTRRH
jgi:hypothetical protein